MRIRISSDINKSFWEKRFKQINHFEKITGRQWHRHFEIFSACFQEGAEEKISGTDQRPGKELEIFSRRHQERESMERIPESL